MSRMADAATDTTYRCHWCGEDFGTYLAGMLGRSEIWVSRHLNLANHLPETSETVWARETEDDDEIS